MDPVVLHADANTRSALRSFDGALVATCHGDCTIVLPHGRYRVDVEETELAPGSSQTIDVYRPTTVHVTSGSKTGRRVGLTLGVLGTVIVPISVVAMLLEAHLYCVDCEHAKPADRTAEIVWGLVGLGGVALATTGWVSFGSSATEVRQTPPFEVGIFPTRNGAWSGLKIAF
jgi:hypothetical protein